MDSPDLESGEDGQEIQTQTTSIVASSYKGPIPDPETLGGYERVSPGSSERIIKMAELEQAHRIKSETTALGTYRISVVAGRVLSGMVILLATYLARPSPWIAAMLIVAMIVATANPFKFMAKSRSRQDNE